MGEQAIVREMRAERAGAAAPVRREARRDEMRVVELAPFPRTAGAGAPQFGFTRDHSASGKCVGVDAAQPVGSLLRVVLRDLHGRHERVSIERVVWCEPTRDGRYWVGLELLFEREPIRRRPSAAEAGGIALE